MKESRITSKGMWWDGQYGGVYKNGTFLMLYIKPILPTIDKYDEMSCWPNAPAGDDMCYTVYHGVKSPLSKAHIDYISGVIDAAIPDVGGGGGGGGGGDPRAIVDIHGMSADSFITVKRSDGTSQDVDIGATIQNTPPFTLKVNLMGDFKAPHRVVSAGDGAKLGATITNWTDKVVMPSYLFEKGGVRNGGDFDPATGEITVYGNNLEITTQVGYCLCVHPDYPKYAGGLPIGTYTTYFTLERKNEDGTWTEMGKKLVSHRTVTSANSFPFDFGFSNTNFKCICPQAGVYRVVFQIADFGDKDPAMLPYIRFGVASAAFSTTGTTFWQITGVMQSVSTEQPIPPTPLP